MRNRWEDIFYTCEWLDCNAVFDLDETFYDHVLQHVQEVIDKPCEEKGGEPAPTCLWCSCVVEADSQYIMRHLYYHAFHTKLMARGGHLSQINKWPHCRADSSNRVVIPIIPGPFICGWRLCDFQANNVDIFYAHVESHPQQEYRDSQYPSDQLYMCQWDDCSHRSGRIAHLVVHLASHTRKRGLACRHCGDMFVSADNLREHLLRQAMLAESSEERAKTGVTEHACLQCGRVYASERMLRDHLRRHVNVLKCEHCEMTCSSKYALKRHITYKHMEARPFSCELCSYSAKTSSDLVQHVQVFHDNVRSPLLCCSHCRYTCKRMNSMIKHERMAHPNAKDGDQPGPSNSSRMTDRPPYACHLCKNRYQWGKKLSAHLRTKHNLRLPPGFSKFTYQLCEDGCRRLQTTRVDSLEVIQQILGENEVERLLASNEQGGSSDPQPEEGVEGATAAVTESEQESCVIIDLQTDEGALDFREEASDDVLYLPGDAENPL